MYTSIVPCGPYKGYIVQSLPDSVLEVLWQELNGHHAGSGDEPLPYSDEERALEEMIICETVDRWNQAHDDKIFF